MQIRNRIKELRQVPAADLLPNPKNWRRHPVGQANALRGALAEIGYADALIAYETPDGLMLIDGHLRAETTPDSSVPVLVTDLTETEADKLLATLDPLSAMADTDQDSLAALLEQTEIENDDLRTTIESLLGDRTIPDDLVPPDDFPAYDDNIATDYKCPSCQYEWSGAPKR
jgi:hypothetical protein